jgi:hypothetical protein
MSIQGHDRDDKSP